MFCWGKSDRLTLSSNENNRRLSTNQRIKQDVSNEDLLVFSLPLEIFFLIQNYLTPSNYRSFISTSKIFITQNIRFHSIIYNLTIASSLRFYYITEFASHVRNKVHSSSRQIMLQIRPSSSWSCNVEYFPESKFSDLQRRKIRSTPFMEEGKTKEIENMSVFQNLHSLSLLSILELREIKVSLLNTQRVYLDYLPVLENIEGLATVKNVTIRNCNSLSDFSPLQGVPTILIHACARLTDFSVFRGNNELSFSALNNNNAFKTEDLAHFVSLKCLTIENCINIRSLDSLQSSGIEELSIINPSSLLKCHYPVFFPTLSRLSLINYKEDIDFAPFANVSYLALQYSKISSLTCFWNLRKIELLDCDSVSDVSCLENCVEVVLNCCRNISSVKSLGRVKRLYLSYLPNLVSLEGLGHGNDYVLVHCCEMIESYEPIHNVSTVEIKVQPNLIKSQEFREVKNITFDSCDGLREVEWLGLAKTVTLRDCQGIVELKGLKKVPIVSFVACGELKDISGMGENRKVRLASCAKITEVFSLRNVSEEVDLSFCKGVRDITVLGQVPIVTLKSVECNKVAGHDMPNVVLMKLEVPSELHGDKRSTSIQLKTNNSI